MLINICNGIFIDEHLNQGRIHLQHTRIAVAFTRWNFLLFSSSKKIKKFQRANVTAIRVCCK